MGSELVCLETWINKNWLVRKKRMSREEECVEDKGEEDQEQWFLNEQKTQFWIML